MPMSRRTTRIAAVVLLVLMVPVVFAIPLAIFVDPAFLLLLLVLVLALPVIRADRRQRGR